MSNGLSDRDLLLEVREEQKEIHKEIKEVRKEMGQFITRKEAYTVIGLLVSGFGLWTAIG